MEETLSPALFLDRDGVIIENQDNYVRRWSDVTIFPEALAALALAKSSPYKIVLVTNQSAVGRGLVTLETVQEINAELVQRIESAGGRVDGIFICPHAPEDHCTCRKPLPGLMLQAASSLHLDLKRSIMVGDALTDVQAGQAAGIGISVLVCTGRGTSQISLPQAGQLQPFFTFENVLEAIRQLVLPHA